MIDRELLEKAAKAAGFGDEQGRTIWTESEYPRGSGKHGALWNGNGHMHTAELWNPLTDDGDALRLEVDLNLTQKHRFLEILYEENGLCDGDYRKARRRAIVRAAAEIGEKT